MTPRNRVRQRPNTVVTPTPGWSSAWCCCRGCTTCWATRTTKQLLDDIRPAKEGFDGDGRSHVYQRLASRDGVKVPTADLERYDSNIREHLAAMNAGRSQPITLRYFQYLAALYTEMFLDRYGRSPATLLHSLNRHVAKLNSNRHGNEAADPYEESDLKKLALAGWRRAAARRCLCT